MAKVGENLVSYNGGVTSQEVPSRCSFMGEAVNTMIHGQHYENAVRGRMFAYGVSSQALLLSATTGNVPTIWNPSGSNMVFIPVAIRLSFISGTTVIGGLNWAVTTGAGATKGTGLPIVTFTEVLATNCAIGSSGGAARTSQMKFSPSISTFTAAPTFFASTGISVGAVAPTNGGGPFPVNEDGKIVLYPGAALSLCYTVTTSTALFATTIYGLELPQPAGGL